MVEKAMGDITRATRKVLMDYDTRRQVEAFAQTYQKSDDQVISEAEHIVTSSGMDFTDDYKIIKGRTALLEELSRVHYALELGAADRRDKRTAASGDKDEFGGNLL